MTRRHLGLTAFVAVLAWLLALSAGPAWGGTASLQLSERGGERVAQLSYLAAPWEADAIEIRFDWSEDGSAGQAPAPPAPPPKAYIVTKLERVSLGFDGRSADASLIPGPGCAGLGLESVRCPVPADARALGPLVELGDRADGVRIVMVEPDTRVHGRTGSDRIEGVGWLHGGPGGDEIAGGGRIFGGPGVDILGEFSRLGRPSPRLFTAGDDVIHTGPGGDVVDGGGGDDLIRARSGAPDFLHCSEGRDTVVADVEDYTLLGCERVRRAGPPRIVPEALFWSVGDDDLALQGWCPSDGPTVCVAEATLRVGQRLIGAGPIRLGRGRFGSADVHVGWPTIVRFRRQRVRVTVRTSDRQGVLRTASRTLRMFSGDEEGDGD